MTDETKTTVYYCDEAIAIRSMRREDADLFYQTFLSFGWPPHLETYENYFREQEEEKRKVFIAEYKGEIGGICTLVLNPCEGPFAKMGYAEIVDLNVFMHFQKLGIGNRLLDAAECEAFKLSDQVYLAVGVHSGYGQAQRIYVKRGYNFDGSDVSSYFHGGEQNRIFKGFEFGYEMVSEIVEAGKDVTDFKVGEYVYPYPLFAKNDMSRATTVGEFSEYVLIPNVKLNHSLYNVDENEISLKAAKRSRPQKGENAIVFGAGAIGYSVAMALKHFGCDKVMIADYSDFRLENAAKQRFYTCNNAKENLKAKAMGVFGQAMNLMGMTCNVDIYIDAVGHKSIFKQFMGLAKLYA